MMSKLWLVAAVGSMVGMSASARADYFVRPYLNFSGGATIDGLIENGDTSSSQSFSNASRTGKSSVNIETAELKAFAEIVGSDDAFLIASAVMGETITVRTGKDTDFYLRYDFDGTVDADAKSIPADPGTYLLQASAHFAVFRPGIASWDDWYAIATTTNQELFFDTYRFSVTNPSVDISESIADYFEFSTFLASDLEQFEVFISIDLVVSSTTPQTATLDFYNTGTLSFDAAPGVQVFSDSGAFPNTLQNPVPEPATALMGLVGLGCLVARRRRK